MEDPDQSGIGVEPLGRHGSVLVLVLFGWIPVYCYIREQLRALDEEAIVELDGSLVRDLEQ